MSDTLYQLYQHQSQAYTVEHMKKHMNKHMNILQAIHVKLPNIFYIYKIRISYIKKYIFCMKIECIYYI